MECFVRCIPARMVATKLFVPVGSLSHGLGRCTLGNGRERHHCSSPTSSIQTISSQHALLFLLAPVVSCRAENMLDMHACFPCGLRRPGTGLVTESLIRRPALPRVSELSRGLAASGDAPLSAPCMFQRQCDRGRRGERRLRCCSCGARGKCARISSTVSTQPASRTTGFEPTTAIIGIAS